MSAHSAQKSQLAAAGPLVDAAWVARHLEHPGLVLLEVDEHPVIYRLGHAPGAHCIDWRTDLQDPITRDLPDREAIARLWHRVGIRRDSLAVVYGDNDNWHACFAYWLFRLYGLDRVAVLDGGRQAWVSANHPLTQDEPPKHVDGRSPRPASHPDPRRRALWTDVLAAIHARTALLDVRTPEEYRGDLLTEPGYPLEAAQRPGHIPTAVNLPWDRAVALDGRFRPHDELRALVAEAGIDPDGDAPVIAYCRIGERSAHTWFVLHELLGLADVRNYDGSWTEWGSMIGMPVTLGDQPGEPASDADLRTVETLAGAGHDAG